MRTNPGMVAGRTNRGLMMVLVAALVAALALALAISPVSAHVHFESSSPEADSTSFSVPTEIRLVFDGELAAEGHTITLTGPDGEQVELEAAQLDLDDLDRRTIFVPLPSDLSDGTYTVEFAAVPSDGHDATTGTFSFSIGDEVSAATPAVGTPVATPVGTPEATPAAQSAGGATATDSGFNSNALFMAGGLVLVAVGLVLFTRRNVAARS